MRRLSNSAALVDNWFDMLPPQQQPTVRALHRAVLDAAPQLQPSVKWGNLAYLEGSAQLLSISTHRTHVQLQAARVLSQFSAPGEPETDAPAQEHPLARPLKCRYSQPVDEEQVAHLVHLCMALRQQAGSAWGRGPAQPLLPGGGRP